MWKAASLIQAARQLSVTLTALVSDALRSTLAEPPPAEFHLALPVTQSRRMLTLPTVLSNDRNFDRFRTSGSPDSLPDRPFQHCSGGDKPEMQLWQ